MLAAVALIASLASEVLALVNGKPITRAQLETMLNERERTAYHEAMADLLEDEHAAVRDFLGRQAIERETADGRVPRDSAYARTMATHFNSFDANLRNRIQQQRERIYSLERSALDQLIDQRLFEAAARAKGTTADELIRTFAQQVPPPSKADIEFIKAYEQSKSNVSVNVPPGEARLAYAVRDARVGAMRAAFLDSVRKQAQVGTRLDPPRVTVSTAGGSRVGPANAPVSIVVFTDFECPYCRESEYTLKTLRELYADRLAITYLNYPLPNHLYGMPSAVASACAEAQGKYMAMHDYLFAHQEGLKDADYAGWAEKAGLDRKAFEACKASGSAQKIVEQHIREGVAAGVSSTPTFLVNGRLITDTDGLLKAVAEEAAAKR